MIDRHVGAQHGTGKKSVGRNQSGHWSTRPWMMSELVSRWRGSNVRWRPAWVTGWNTTPCTAGMVDAVADDGAELVGVDAGLDCGDQHHGQAGLGAPVQRLGLGLA